MVTWSLLIALRKAQGPRSNYMNTSSAVNNNLGGLYHLGCYTIRVIKGILVYIVHYGNPYATSMMATFGQQKPHHQTLTWRNISPKSGDLCCWFPAAAEFVEAKKCRK